MRDSKTAYTVGETEREIARLLAALEVATNSVVDRIAVESLEVTQMEDARKQLRRRVVIDLRPEPGSHWEE